MLPQEIFLILDPLRMILRRCWASFQAQFATFYIPFGQFPEIAEIETILLLSRTPKSTIMVMVVMNDGSTTR